MVNHRDGQRFAALARAVERRLSEFKPQELTNTAWAFATVSHCDEKPVSALARAAKRLLSVFKSQELAITVWAFATVNHRDEHLFAALARSAERRLSEFNVQGVEAILAQDVLTLAFLSVATFFTLVHCTLASRLLCRCSPSLLLWWLLLVLSF